jgi:hypothetical protein
MTAVILITTPAILISEVERFFLKFLIAALIKPVLNIT